MTSPIVRAASRRRFLQYLAASPVLASGVRGAFGMEAPSKLPDPMIWAPPGSGELITSPKDAINVFEFEPVARKNVPPAPQNCCGHDTPHIRGYRCASGGTRFPGCGPRCGRPSPS